MKLEPIKNPHSKVNQVQKKTKQEEKDEIIDKTKKNTLDKYGKKSINKKYLQITAEMKGTGQNFGDKDDFKLEEKVTKESQGIKLIQEGSLQSFIDFFYITNETTPSVIQPSKKLQEEYRLNKRKKYRFQQTQENLLRMSDNLVQAEMFLKENNIRNCFQTYMKVAQDFEQNLLDYETASYFYQRCLDVSIDFKDLEGESRAYKGLGFCEEKVFNIFESKAYLEMSLEKTIDGINSGNVQTISTLKKLRNEIYKDLVRVYQKIAIDFQDKEEFNKALEYFEKCNDAANKYGDKEKEAECYQKIGLIYEKLGDLDKSIVELQKFLQICETHGFKDNQGEAHKKLAETHSKNGNIPAAIKHLEQLLHIAIDDNKKQQQADAALKLGLLHYQIGSIKKSVDYLQRHFELARQEEEKKNMNQIDAARVNLGIAQANTMIDNYKYLVLNDLQSLLEWKIKRSMKK